MYLVVVHHSISHSHFATSLPLLPIFLLSVPAVDGFLSISGWFGVKFSWRKCGVLSGQILYYAILGSAFSLVAARMGWIERPIFAVGNAWYGVAYLALMMVSPILNAGMDALLTTGRARASVVVVCVLFVVDYLSRAFGLGFSVNGFGSHTFATFLVVYCLSYLARRVYLPRYEKQVLLGGAVALVFYVALFAGFGYAARQPVSCVDVVSRLGFYNCPLVMAIAFSAVLLFSKLKVGNGVARVASFIAPSMFAVYLIHDASPIGKMLLLRPIQSMDGSGALLLYSGCLFVACVAIDLTVRRLPLLIFNRLRN